MGVPTIVPKYLLQTSGLRCFAHDISEVECHCFGLINSINVTGEGGKIDFVRGSACNTNMYFSSVSSIYRAPLPTKRSILLTGYVLQSESVAWVVLHGLFCSLEAEPTEYGVNIRTGACLQVFNKTKRDGFACGLMHVWTGCVLWPVVVERKIIRWRLRLGLRKSNPGRWTQ